MNAVSSAARALPAVLTALDGLVALARDGANERIAATLFDAISVRGEETRIRAG